MDIAQFKSLNAQAQQINAEIQKAQGALDENRRQFEKLCEGYKATYGEEITADNLEAILAKTMKEVQDAAAIQAEAIAKAQQGIVIQAPSATTQAPVAQTPAQAIQSQPQVVAPIAQAVAPVQQAVAPVQQAVATPVAPKPVSAASIGAAAVQQSASPINYAQPVGVEQAPKLQPAVTASGWGITEGAVDFDKVLGGKFGG